MNRSRLITALVYAAAVVVSGGAVAGVFEQSDWTTHTADPDLTTARHPANQTGWTRFVSAPGEVETGDVVTMRRALAPLSERVTAELGSPVLTGVALRGADSGAYLTLAGTVDLGDGADGQLIVDGQYGPNSSDGVAHPRSVDVPGAPTVIQTSTNGALAAGSYSYQVTALSVAGETTASVATAFTSNGRNLEVRWNRPLCATGYRVYRGGLRLAEISDPAVTSFIDNGALTPVGAPPTVDGSARPLVLGRPWRATSIVLQSCAAMDAAPVAPLPVVTAVTATTVAGGGGLSAGMLYYTIRAVDRGGVEARTGIETNVYVNQSGSGVHLSWAGSPWAGGYRVFRSSVAGSYGAQSLVCDSVAASCFDAGAPPQTGAPCNDCNGLAGGRIVLKALNTLTVDATSTLTVRGRGYAGGSGGGCGVGGQGQSYRGTPAVATTALYSGGGGAGGYGAPGAGGGHGGIGASYGAYAGGAAFGAADQLHVTFGGGGGGASAMFSCTASGLGGGAGGGGIELSARDLTVLGSLDARGAEGLAQGNGIVGGAGAGGGIRLQAATVRLGPSSVVTAAGGVAATRGGGGRVAIYTQSGSAQRDAGALVDVGPIATAQLGSVNEYVLGAATLTGSYESAVQDLGGPLTQGGPVSWDATIPAGTSVRMQVATSVDGVTFGEYLGPDCTADTHYEVPGELLCADHLGDRYLKMRVELASTTAPISPAVAAITIMVDTLHSPLVLVSSTYDTGDPANQIESVSWTGAVPTGAEIALQLSTAPTAGGPWTAFMGPTDAASWYLTPASGAAVQPLHRDGSDDRWMQYRVRLSSTTAEAPTLSQVVVAYAIAHGVDGVIDDQGRDVWGANGAGGSAEQSIQAGATASFNVEVRNPGRLPDTYRIGWTAPAGMTVTLAGSPTLSEVGPVAAGAAWTGVLALATPTTMSGLKTVVVSLQSASDTTKTDSIAALVEVIGLSPAGPVTPATPLPNAVAVHLNAPLCWEEPSGTAPFTYEAGLALDLAMMVSLPVADADPDDRCVEPQTLLNPGTRYYWRVRGDNTQFGPGPWPASPWSFETGHVPPPPVAAYPAPDMLDAPVQVSLTWNPALGGPGSAPTCYEVGFGLTAEDAQAQAGPTTDCVNSLLTDFLSFETTYTWCVRGLNAYGTGPWGCYAFTTGSRELPGPPVWVRPSDGALAQMLRPSLAWSPSAGPPASVWAVGVGLTDEEAQATAVHTTATDLLWGSSLTPNTAYRACVLGMVEIWSGPPSCIGFTTGAVPSPAALVFPIDGVSNLVPPSVRLLWRQPGIVSALGYRVALWETANAAATRVETVVTERWSQHTVKPATAYGWEVIAFNNIGDSASSGAWSFTTAAAPDKLAAVAIVMPDRGIEKATYFSFDGSFSTTRIGHPIQYWQWELGDGTPPIPAIETGYIYPAAGGYQVLLQVEDDEGQQAETRVPILVLGTDGQVPPLVRVDAQPLIGDAPLRTTLTATVGLGSGAVLAVVWALGDGNTAEGIEIEHVYGEPGIYVARATVVAERGLMASDFVMVSVADPVTGRTGFVTRAYVQPAKVAVGEEVAPSCLAADPENAATTFTFAWDLGDSSTATGDRPTPHVYTEPGVYTLTCTATASTGETGTATVEVQVGTESGAIPPRIISQPTMTELCAGDAYFYNDARRAVARGTTPIDWSLGKRIGDELVGAPPGMQVGATGLVSWTPATPGAYTMVLVAQNVAGSATQETAITVLDCSPPPPKKKEDEGCNCRSSTGGTPWLVAVLLVLARRRRRRDRSGS